MPHAIKRSDEDNIVFVSGRVDGFFYGDTTQITNYCHCLPGLSFFLLQIQSQTPNIHLFSELQWLRDYNELN